MPLTPGTRLGPYEILGPVGAGGMGEVYRARDTRLDRDVAIKVLPDAFAQDRERLARFERESRTLAALNHPHVAHVYGVESGALIMEFVDGEDLAERLARDGAMPIGDALPVALQIAEALEAAHEQGIVHRDLKPANVKIRPDGTAKVLDFGLAKALVPADAGRSPELADSPTITTPFQMSALGVILGTAAYMAPEQAKGRTVDKRADIWAFGCVLYEMLTGRRAFEGEDVTDTLAAIVRAEPDWSRLPAETPASIRTLLRRALEKNPRDRLPDIGTARLDLKDAQAGRAPSTSTSAPSGARPLPWLPWAIAGAAVMIAVGAAVYALRNRPLPDVRIFKMSIIPPAPLSGAPALRFTLSPDGRRLAFVAPDSAGNSVVWVRGLDEISAHALSDTANAASPFWSPDSKSIAFFAGNHLRRIDANGGAAQSLCDALSGPPGSWGRQDVILFTGTGTRIQRIAATGGKPVDVTEPLPDPNGGTQISPVFLPDQRHFLFTATTGGSHSRGVYLASLDSKQVTRLVEASSNAAYAGGYLMFLRQTTLMAQRFDPDTLALSGPELPVALDVQINTATGTGAFSVSDSGILAYQSGPSSGTAPTWFDRSGAANGTLAPPGGYRDVQLSPDDQWASLTLTDDRGQSPDVWLFDLARGGLRRRFTFDGGYAAVWSPDSLTIAYASPQGDGSAALVSKQVSGAAAEQPLLRDGKANYPLAFTRDGKYLLYAVQTRANGGTLYALPLLGDRIPRQLIHSTLPQTPGEVSPDGRWLAYTSSEPGRREVFVTSFPDAAGQWQISTNGGESPRWRADGKELFFVSGDRFVATEVVPRADRFDSGVLRQLFEIHVPAPQLGTRSTYAPTRDGQRFLFNTWDAKAALSPIIVVVNWPEAIAK
jgi:serine/threonine protein kinase/Tol biopolymer transport system component